MHHAVQSSVQQTSVDKSEFDVFFDHYCGVSSLGEVGVVMRSVVHQRTVGTEEFSANEHDLHGITRIVENSRQMPRW